MNKYFNDTRGFIINTVRFGFSSLRDTLSDDFHSKDFIYARGDYLRSKVLIIGSFFILLLPLWTIFDSFLIPVADKTFIYIARAIMLALLLVVVLIAKYSNEHLKKSRIAAGAVLTIPAVFYLFVLYSLTIPTPLLTGYSFIPYMLIAMLAIFPFTLLESLAMGIFLILVHMYALYIASNLFTLPGLQDIWLLAALLSISLTANYFQLGLMLRLYREATHDPLTGLLNRGALMRTIEQLQADPDTKLSALIMMDLDNFKRINDNYGHMFGDEVLKNFTKILTSTISNNDVAARYGGEEFIAILVDTNKEQAMQMAEQIRSNTEKSVLDHAEFGTVNYTVSIGVAMLEPGEPFEQAAKQADNRLYEAKEKSRNTVVGF